MRVGLDCRYIRERPSGIGTYVQALVDRLPALGPADHFVFWAHSLARGPLSSAPNVTGTTVAIEPNSPLTMLWPRRYFALDGLDVFHNPQNVLPRGLPCATVVTVHDVLALDHPDLHRRGLERLAKRWFFPQAVRRALDEATRIIVPSRATADRVLAWAPGAGPRLRVIPNAPDPGFERPPDAEAARRRASALVGGDAPYLLVVGEHSPTKRHDVALQAFAAAVPPPWRLVLLQRLGRRSPLMHLARTLRVNDRTVWLRNVSRDDVVALMQAAGLLVQPSIYEGFGLPVVEAMAAGCPVVASDIPPLREVAGTAAMLVPPSDVTALAAALRELVGSPGRRQELSAAGLDRARAFSWDRSARQTLEVYREAADAGG